MRRRASESWRHVQWSTCPNDKWSKLPTRFWCLHRSKCFQNAHGFHFQPTSLRLVLSKYSIQISIYTHILIVFIPQDLSPQRSHAVGKDRTMALAYVLLHPTYVPIEISLHFGMLSIRPKELTGSLWDKSWLAPRTTWARWIWAPSSPWTQGLKSNSMLESLAGPLHSYLLIISLLFCLHFCSQSYSCCMLAISSMWWCL